MITPSLSVSAQLIIILGKFVSFGSFFHDNNHEKNLLEFLYIFIEIIFIRNFVPLNFSPWGIYTKLSRIFWGNFFRRKDKYLTWCIFNGFKLRIINFVTINPINFVCSDLFLNDEIKDSLTFDRKANGGMCSIGKLAFGDDDEGMSYGVIPRNAGFVRSAWGLKCQESHIKSWVKWVFGKRIKR